MFFGNKTMDDMGFDFSTKEGRDKARAKLEELLSDGTPQDRAAARVLKKLFGVMDDVPNDFALVHEVKDECAKMSAKLTDRSAQLDKVVRRLGDHGQPVHRFGMVDAYITIACGSLAAASNLLGKLETYVAQQSAAKEEEEKAATGEGPSGSSETPTEYPPPQPPEAPMAAEAPLG